MNTINQKMNFIMFGNYKYFYQDKGIHPFTFRRFNIAPNLFYHFYKIIDVLEKRLDGWKINWFEIISE